MADQWLSQLSELTGGFIAVWTEEISDMSGDELWARSLRSYLSGLDDDRSEGFLEAARQSYLDLDGGRLVGSNETPLGLALTGYPWV